MGKRTLLAFLLAITFFSRGYAQIIEEKKRIIIVGTAWAMAKYLEKASIDLGYKPILLANIDGYSTQLANIIRESEWYDVDVSSYEKVETFLQEHWEEFGEVAGITSLTDMRLPIARKLAEKFNVPGPDRAVLQLSDKQHVAKLIPEYTPPTLSFSLSEIPLDELGRMMDLYGEIVIKPTRGSGALGTIRVREKLKLPGIRSLLMGAGLENLDSFEWLAQAHISGTLYSLEGYCLKGKPTFLGLTRRSRIAMSEMANHFPSDLDPLIQKNKAMLYGGINALIERSLFQNGYFHCEFLVNEQGAYLIDANFGRIGGAAMIEQFAHSFEITPEEMARHVIDVGLFNGIHSPNYTYKCNPRPSLCLCYGMQEEGRLSKVNLPAHLRSFHTMIAKDCAFVTAIGSSDYSWVGIISGDPEQVLQEVKEITIETENNKIIPAFYFID